MAFYLNVENGKITSASNQRKDSATVKSYSVPETVYYDFLGHEEKYKLDKKTDTIIVDTEYEKNQAVIREEEFKKQFFETSLGWIRRYPTLADGTKDDFLNNDLPLFAIALQNGQQVYLPVAYKLPDFTNELTDDYMKGLQILNQTITAEFLAECLQIKLKDFTGVTEQSAEEATEESAEVEKEATNENTTDIKE